MDPLTGYCFGGIMLNVDDDITTRFPWRRGHAGREIPAKRARARDHLCPDSWIWYPPYSLVGVDSAEGTEVSAASDVATVSAENSLQNGSFEQPDVYQYRETSDVPYWKSTTTSGNIEIGSVFKNGNGDNDSLHMRTGEKVAAAEGSQFGKPATSNGNDQYAELNSNQASSLYQVVNTVPESKYDWGLYHRGRQGKDAMALVVGPKQNVAPMKTSATSNDQLQQIVTWVSGQQDRDFGLDMVHFSQTGTSRKITVYTTKFASGGRFDTTGVSSPFSWSKDSRHTERWELWIIVSDCDEWYGHGEFNGDEDPDASYIVPEGQNETLLGFVAVSTSTGDITSGNLLDAVQFRQYYRMDFQTPPSGSGTYSTDGETPVAFDSAASKSDYALVGSDVTVSAKPVDASHHFLGAYVGDTFVDANQWTANADGSYSLTRTLTANLSVRLMFSANTVVYNVNGGDPYDSDNPETGHEIYIKRGSSYTNKTAATKRNDDGWRFTDWKYDDDHILGVNHKITYGSKTNDLSISQNDQTVVSGIPAEKGITLTAQWTYRQAFATTPEEDAEYTSFLNEDPNGVMAYINIPRLKSTLPIYHYTTPESLQKGVGHLRGSALPVGGKNTHAVLSAHRGLPTSRLFTDLDKVRKGDHFYITVLNRTLAYEVDRISVVKPDQTKELSVQPGKDLVTLVTCTPYGVNTQRLLVRGHRVPYNAAQAKHEAADSAVSSFTVYGFVATYGTLAIALAGIAVLRRNAAARTPHHAADWPHSLTVSVR